MIFHQAWSALMNDELTSSQWVHSLRFSACPHIALFRSRTETKPCFPCGKFNASLVDVQLSIISPYTMFPVTSKTVKVVHFSQGWVIVITWLGQTCRPFPAALTKLYTSQRSRRITWRMATGSRMLEDYLSLLFQIVPWCSNVYSYDTWFQTYVAQFEQVTEQISIHIYLLFPYSYLQCRWNCQSKN